MSTVDDISQTIKGKTQQIQGEIQQQRGNGVKGGISKLKGKTNEAIGRAKLRSEKERKTR